MSCDKVNGTIENNNNNVTKKLSDRKHAEVPLMLEEDMEKRKSLIILGSIFIAGLFALVYIYKNFPALDEYVGI